MNRKTFAIPALLLLLWCSSPVLAEKPWAWQPSTLELHGQNVSFEWAVPKLVRTPGDTALWQKLIDRQVADRLNEFQNSFDAARREDEMARATQADYQPVMWESKGGYKVVWADDDQMVLLWEGYDYRGGAHGISVTRVDVLDARQPDSLLSASALFTDETEALRTLSEAARAELPAKLGVAVLDDLALQGTEPTWDNFAAVYPSHLDGPKRFEVVFPSYRVAPYAAGTPSVVLPWETLSGWTPSLEDMGQLP